MAAGIRRSTPRDALPAGSRIRRTALPARRRLSASAHRRRFVRFRRTLEPGTAARHRAGGRLSARPPLPASAAAGATFRSCPNCRPTPTISRRSCNCCGAWAAAARYRSSAPALSLCCFATTRTPTGRSKPGSSLATFRLRRRRGRPSSSRTMWGVGPDPDVMANLLYALVLADGEDYAGRIARGVA